MNYGEFIFIRTTERSLTAIAIVFLTFIIGASILWWFVAGRKYFTGPLIEAELQSLSSGDSEEVKFDKASDREKVVEEELRHQRAL